MQSALTPRLASVLRGVLFKESVKLRGGIVILLALSAALMLHMFIETRHLFRLDHAEIVWYRVIGLGQIHYSGLRYAPLLSGAALAFLQFLPEMRDERMRLSLHLPAGSNLVVLAHLFAGLCALGLIIVLQTTGLSLITLMYFPREVCSRALLTALPWFTAGLTTYLGVTLTLLEPRLKLRIFNLLLTAALAAIMLRDVPPGAYARSWPALAAVPPLLVLAALLPAYHFRHRREE